MKFIKKAAALFFCAALALSVMAVGALADDEAELFLGNTGQVTVETNNNFEVTLTRKNVAGKPISRDNVSGYEINADTDVMYDITLNYKGSDYTNLAKSIDAVQFDFKPGNNYGATLSDFTINYGKGENASSTQAGDLLHGNIDASAYFDSTNTTEDTYAYTAVGSDATDIWIPVNTAGLSYDETTDTVTNGVIIGTITVSFDYAKQAIDIYPQIENLQFHVRGVESPQQPASTDSTNDNSNPVTNMSGTITGGKDSPEASNYPGGTFPSTSTPSGCVIKAKVPVIVNPIYTVTLETFENDGTTGILKKANATSTLKYDFTNGSFQTSNAYSDGTNATVLSNDFSSIYGYTLQGWMVTTFGNKNASGSNGSDTWAEYDSTNLTPSWNKTTSYPATTTAMSHLNTAKIQWSTEADNWYTPASGVTNGRKEAVANASYTYLTNPQVGVNFIPVAQSGEANYVAGEDADSKGYTMFPVGMVGDITLTPVYTRNVYTATFKSGNDDATFASDIKTATDASITIPNPSYDATNGGGVSVDTKVGIFTKQYTIEDLTSNGTIDGSVTDFLSLQDPDGETALQKYTPAGGSETDGNAAGPWGVTRKAYKFMGWTPSVTDGSDSPVSGYGWTTTGAISTYDTTKQVLKTASFKHYGDVTFTAEWEEDIYYAEIGYQYAGGANVMVLVAVPSGADGASELNFDASYTYKFNDNPMFIVNDANATRKTAYANYATTLCSDEDKITENFPSTMPANYVLFAYIAAANADSPEHRVTIDEAETNATRANVTLSYNGDVDGSNSISVADFGNVDTLFADATNSAVFAITGETAHYGVKARLQADAYAADAETTLTGQGTLKKFASISDIKTIYDKMGYNTMT